MSRFLSGHSKGSSKEAHGLIADKVEIYQLCQSREWFKSAYTEERARLWMQDSVEDSYAIYLIVGYCILHDARHTEAVNSAESFGGSVQLPVASAATAFGVDALLGDTLDISGSGSRKHTSAQLTVALSKGKRVGGVQYRKVKFSWYSSKIEKASLARDNRWQVHWGVRGEEDEDEEDIIEADLDGQSDVEEEEEDEDHENDQEDDDDYVDSKQENGK